MNYNKNSFLAGIVVGQQLKGWAQSKGTGGGGGSIPNVLVTTEPQSFAFPLTTQLTCEREGALIYYSTDGETPSTLYDGGDIYIDHTMTIVAFAVFGRLLSSMSSYTYTFIDIFNQTEEVILNTAVPGVSEGGIEIGISTLAIEVSDSAVVSRGSITVTGESVEMVIVE